MKPQDFWNLTWTEFVHAYRGYRKFSPAALLGCFKENEEEKIEEKEVAEILQDVERARQAFHNPQTPEEIAHREKVINSFKEVRRRYKASMQWQSKNV